MRSKVSSAMYKRSERLRNNIVLALAFLFFSILKSFAISQDQLWSLAEFRKEMGSAVKICETRTATYYSVTSLACKNFFRNTRVAW